MRCECGCDVYGVGGVFSVARAYVSRVCGIHRSTSFVEPVQSILRFIAESQHNLQRPAELIFQLSNLEDTIVGCLSFCNDQDIGTLLGLASDVHFAVELLLSSDLIDALAYDNQASTWLQDGVGTCSVPSCVCACFLWTARKVNE